MNDLTTRRDLNDPDLVSVIDELPFWSAAFGLKILDTVRYRKAIRALDVGTGSGFPLVELAMRLGGSSTVCGIDPWKAGIDRARRKIRAYGASNASVIEGTAEDMPFRDDEFDLIVSNNGLNNVRDLSLTLSECSRVARAGAQFVFTFNTEDTFREFYDIYRLVLEESGLGAFAGGIAAHIHEKRKPLKEMLTRTESSGFTVSAVAEDEFRYRFADGSAMLRHFFIDYAFADAWRKILPEGHRETTFRRIEERINALAEREGGFTMRVPFATVDSRKVRHGA